MPSLTRSLLFLFLAEFAFYLSGYLVQMGAGRILGPEDYGRYALVITLALLVANLMGNGVPIAMSKLLSEAGTRSSAALRHIKRRAAAVHVAVISVLAVSFAALSPLVAQGLGDPTLAQLLLLAALIIPAYGADAFYFYYFSGIQRFGVQAILKLSRAFLRVILILGLALLAGLWGTLWGYILVPVVLFGGSLILDHFFTPRIPENKDALPTVSFRRIWSLALPMTLFLVLFELFVSFDIYLVKLFSGDDAETGFYSAALNIARIPTYLFYAFTLILLPKVSEYTARGLSRETRNLLSFALRAMLLILIPGFALIALYREPVTVLLYGSAFLPAARLLPALFVGVSLISLIYIFAFAYQGAGRIRIALLFIGGALGANALLLAALSPLGIAGFALAKAAAGVVVAPFFLLSLRKHFDATLPRPALSLLRMGLGAGAIYFVGSLLPISFATLFFGAPVLFLAYLLFLLLTGEFARDDLRLLQEALARKKTASP